MTTMIIFLLVAISAVCWATMNVIVFHHSVSIFVKTRPESFWGIESWKRKYELVTMINGVTKCVTAPDTWYYHLFNIRHRERFPGSATVLAFCTDGYHLCQFIFLWINAVLVSLYLAEDRGADTVILITLLVRFTFSFWWNTVYKGLEYRK